MKTEKYRHIYIVATKKLTAAPGIPHNFTNKLDTINVSIAAERYPKNRSFIFHYR
jgi:hypothetical protein